MTEAECARALRGEVAHWREFIADMAAGLRQGAQAHPEMPILGAGFVKIADQLDEHLRAALSASPPPSGKFAGWSNKELTIALAMTSEDKDFTSEYRDTAVSLHEEAEAEMASRATEPPR
jgi:hypothetical protein